MFSSIIHYLRTHFTITALDQAFRLSFAILLSVCLAQFFHVEFAPSTGVIALLTLQYSKEETWHTIYQRLISYAYTMLIAYLVNRQFGISMFAFCLVIFFVVLISVFLQWNSTLSVNVVILLHLFLQARVLDMPIMINETERLLIGIGCALLARYAALPQKHK